MTIIEAITRTDSVKPNQYSKEEKIRWLSILDGTVKTEIINTHEGADTVPFTPYTTKTPDNTVLLIPDVYAQEVYPAYLSAQIDYANDEIIRYSNDMQNFNTAYSAFANWYNRTFMPLQKNLVRTFASGTCAKPHPWPLQTRNNE